MLDGKECEFEKRLGFNEAVLIQRLTGYKPVPWEKALGEYDALALAALILVHRNRNGESLTSLEQVDNDLLSFDVLAEDEADPTEGEAAAASPASRTSTPRRSRTSTASGPGSGTSSTTPRS
jgi:hypothetical protein